MTHAADLSSTFAGRLHQAATLATSIAQSAHAKRRSAKNLRASHQETMLLVKALEGARRDAQVVASSFLDEAQRLETAAK